MRDLNQSQRRLRKITKLLRRLHMDFVVHYNLVEAVAYDPSGHGDAVIRINLSRAEVVDMDPFEYLTRYIAHELGHWLLATPGNRMRKDYGLPTKETRHSEFNEVKAQILEHIILKRLGIKQVYPHKRPDTFKTVYEMKKWEATEGMRLVGEIFNRRSNDERGRTSGTGDHQHLAKDIGRLQVALRQRRADREAGATIAQREL